METIDQLGQYLICPNLSMFDRELLGESSFRWNTFEHSYGNFFKDQNKLIAQATYKILCEILVENNDPLYKSQKSLSEYEEKYNKQVFIWGDPNREAVAKAAAGWVRLVSIYKKIIELSENYKFILPKMDCYKRIFKQDPISIEFSIPAIFADTKTDSFDVLLIVPYVSKNPSARSFSLYNYFVADFLKASKIDVTEILEISFDERQSSRDFQFNRYWINDNVFKSAETFFESLENNRSPNIHYCNSCVMSSKCSSNMITRKVNVPPKYKDLIPC